MPTGSGESLDTLVETWVTTIPFHPLDLIIDLTTIA